MKDVKINGFKDIRDLALMNIYAYLEKESLEYRRVTCNLFVLDVDSKAYRKLEKFLKSQEVTCCKL